MIQLAYVILVLILATLAGRTSAQTYLAMDPEENPIWDGYGNTGQNWVYNRQPILLAFDENSNTYAGKFFALDPVNDTVFDIDIDIEWDTYFSTWRMYFTHDGDQVVGYIQYENPPTGVATDTATQYLAQVHQPTAPDGSELTYCSTIHDIPLGSRADRWKPDGWAYVLTCARFRMIQYGGGGETNLSVTLDLGEVDDAYDPSQSASPHSFAQDELNDSVFSELHPAPYTAFGPGTEKLPVEFTFKLPGDDEEEVDVSIDLTDLSVTSDGETYSVFGQQESLSGYKQAVRTVALALMTIYFITLHIRMIRDVLGG